MRGAELARKLIARARNFFGWLAGAMAGIGEVWVFGNVPGGVQKFIANAVTTLAAGRENLILAEDHDGAVFIGVADFVQAGVTNERAGHEVAIAIVAGFIAIVKFLRAALRHFLSGLSTALKWKDAKRQRSVCREQPKKSEVADTT